jgi:Spy/CpxP family protein refolding chaperone
MNRKSYFVALTLALLLALTGVRMFAQTDSTSAAVDPATKAKVQQRLQQLSSELNLTDDQKQKIQPILQSNLQQAKSVKDDTSLSPDQKKAKMADIHQNMNSQIAPILTPEQKVKLAAMKDEANH